MLSQDKLRQLTWCIVLIVLTALVVVFLKVRGSRIRMDESQRVDLITIEADQKLSSPAVIQENVDGLTGEDVLLRCYDAYAQTKSYECDFFVESEWEYPAKTATSRIGGSLKYSHPDRLTFAYQDISTGFGATIEYDGEVLQYPPCLSEPGDSVSLLDLLLASNGVSDGASIWLPGILLRTEFSSETIFLPDGPILRAFATHAVIREKSTVDGQECYGVVCERDVATWIFWVDSKEFLLRKLEESATPIQMAAQRKHGGGGFSGEITETRTIHTFGNVVHTTLPSPRSADPSEAP